LLGGFRSRLRHRHRHCPLLAFNLNSPAVTTVDPVLLSLGRFGDDDGDGDGGVGGRGGG
jgi:hypothetical protein